MKKSTILLLAVVYILAFFIIGLLGTATRSHDAVVDISSITLEDIDGKTTLTENATDPEGNFLADYWFAYRGYTSLDTVRIRAVVKPDDSTYNVVEFVRDESNNDYNFKTYETNPDTVEKNFVEISLKEIPDTPLSVRFTVRSTNPGVKIEKIAIVIFASF